MKSLFDKSRSVIWSVSPNVFIWGVDGAWVSLWAVSVGAFVWGVVNFLSRCEASTG